MRAATGIDKNATALADELLEYWSDIAADVTPVPGAPEALRAASRRIKLGVVSSSPRSVIDKFVDRLGVADCIDPRARIGGDMVRASKPDPEGYLQGARSLGVDPGEALVFEDSQAGLLAARAAGMRSMFIRCCAADVPGNTKLATASTTDYRTLPAGFWDAIAGGNLDFAGKVYA
jgi:sugar-phosphatase